MAFRDFKELLKEQAKKVGFLNKDQDDMRGSMPNGGTTGYYPNHSRARDPFATNDFPLEQLRQAEQQGQQNQQPAGMPVMQGTGFQPMADAQHVNQPEQPKDPVAQYTSGFTGFQQPVQPQQQNSWQGTGFQQPAWQGTAYQPPVQPPVQQPAWQGTGRQQPVKAQQSWQQQATGYQPNAAQQPAWQGTDYQQPVQQPVWQGTSYQPPVQPQRPTQQVQTPQQRAMGFEPEQEQRQPRASKRQQRMQQMQQPNNIVYMGNSGFVDDNGMAYTHLERVVQLVSVSACFRVMEFMRNRESIIVNTESIASEADTQRCLDLLAGAAFTLDSSMTKITQLKHAYLIAPNSVLVMADVAVKNWANRDSAREHYETESPERYRPVRGAYVPDRPDEQRRDRYQAQQEYPAQTQGFAQNYR